MTGFCSPWCRDYSSGSLPGGILLDLQHTWKPGRSGKISIVSENNPPGFLAQHLAVFWCERIAEALQHLHVNGLRTLANFCFIAFFHCISPRNWSFQKLSRLIQSAANTFDVHLYYILQVPCHYCCFLKISNISNILWQKARIFRKCIQPYVQQLCNIILQIFTIL